MAGNLDIALKSSRLDSCKPNAVNLTKQSDIKIIIDFKKPTDDLRVRV